MLTLRLVYKRLHCSHFLWLFLLATSDKATCPMGSPMWQGTEADGPTTLEKLNLAKHYVSELGSRISPILTTRYRHQYQPCKATCFRLIQSKRRSRTGK